MVPDTSNDAVATALGVHDASPSAANPVRPLSYGESAVGLSFNPSGDEKVYRAKFLCAQLIDAMNELRSASDDGEVKRLASVAITETQTAQMWIVKALTK